jgi:hypothetical protein
LINLHSKHFQNDQDQFVDLSIIISFDYENFLNGEIAIIAVYPLPDDEKFLRYDFLLRTKIDARQIIHISLIQRQRGI